ncbi:MAG TPA: hypothetical protein DHN33_02915, partial [Eubacteriaceae bacterium]|nr:hypothetical protein [Eubacteriaceae bacterium]
MKEATFIHTADLHLASAFTQAHLPLSIKKELREDTWRVFAQIISDCKEESIDYLWIAGDLFESEMVKISDFERMNHFFQSLDHTKVFIAPGNHDPIKGMRSYDYFAFHENVHVFRSEKASKVEEPAFDLYGVGWQTNTMDAEQVDFSIVEDRGKTKILLIHGDLYDEASDYLPLKKHQDRLEQFDYVALGHIHRPEKLSEKMAYSGSPMAMSFKDRGSRGYYKGVVGREGVQSTFVEMDAKQFVSKEIQIDPEMDYTRILETVKKVADQPKKHLYRIRCKGMIRKELNLEDIENDLKPLYYYIEFRDETLKDFDLEALYETHQNDII